MKSKIREYINNEISELAAPVKKATDQLRGFWNSPGKPELLVCANIPAPENIPVPENCTVTERELYYQLKRYIRPAAESMKYGSAASPVLYPHEGHYDGPKFGTHFLAAVLGAEVTYPKDAEKIGWYSWANPIIEDKSQFDMLEEIDVSRSPVLRAILQALEETAEIVQGRIPITYYSPTLVLDFAAEVIGHIKFYEMAAEDPEAARKLLDICLDKWLDMLALEEKAAGTKLSQYLLMPGIRISDMILLYFSPDTIREVILPYNIRIAKHFGACVAEINHKDTSLIDDYLGLPGLRGISVPADWPSGVFIDRIGSEYAFMGHFSYHFHKGEKPHAPICVSWEDACLRRVADASGKMRMLVNIYCTGNTYEDKVKNVLRDMEEVKRVWAASS